MAVKPSILRAGAEAWGRESCRKRVSSAMGEDRELGHQTFVPQGAEITSELDKI